VVDTPVAPADVSPALLRERVQQLLSVHSA
jgi:hypothetical protein